MAIEKHISDSWRMLLDDSMKQSGEEEKAIALSKQDYRDDDIPRISGRRLEQMCLIMQILA